MENGQDFFKAEPNQEPSEFCAQAEFKPLALSESQGERKSARIKKKVQKYFTTKKIAYLAVFTALSAVLYIFVKVSLPMVFPFFLDFQFSEVPALIGGYMFGPVAGSIILIVKTLIKLPFTSTFCVGELCDLILGLAFVIPSSLLYKKFKTRRAAVLGLAIGSAAVMLAAVLVNRFISVPFYASLFGGLQNIVDALTGLYEGITIDTFYAYYLPFGVIPFNLIRTVISAILAFLLYEGLRNADKRLFPVKKHEKKNDKSI